MTGIAGRGKLTEEIKARRDKTMQSINSTTLASFHQFIGQQLASESASQISPELALAMWRERQDSVAAIREGLADVDAGRSSPADEVIRELRAELHEA